MEIYLIRHTQVNLPEGICYGFSDVDVSENFEEDTASILKKINIDKSFITFSSPLIRCIKLSKLIGTDELYIDERLKEINFGDWELKKWNEIDRLEIEKWSNDYVSNNCPAGESFSDLYKRVIEFYNDILLINKDIIVVTHGGVIRCLLANILEIPLKNAHKIKVNMGSITKITIDKAITVIDYINM